MVELGFRFPLQGPGSLRWELRPPQSLLSPPSIVRELSETQTPLGRKWRPRFWPFTTPCDQIRKNQTKFHAVVLPCNLSTQKAEFETRLS